MGSEMCIRERIIGEKCELLEKKVHGEKRKAKGSMGKEGNGDLQRKMRYSEKRGKRGIMEKTEL